MRPMTPLMPLAALLLASGCGNLGRLPPPPADDVEAVTTEKPEPSPEAVTNAKVKADDDAAIEKWGDDLLSAGVSLCLLLEEYFEVDYDCGEL